MIKRSSQVKLYEWLSKNTVRLWQSATQRVMSITAVGMLLALLLDILLASRFGTTAATDALIIALTLPRLIETVAREGTRYSLVAVLVDVSRRFSRSEFNRFISSLMDLSFILGIVIVFAGWFLSSLIISWLGPGLDTEANHLSVILFRIMLFFVPIVLVSTVFEIMLNSQKHFAIVSARNGFVPFVVIIVMLLRWRDPEILIWVATAHTIGYVVFAMFLFVYSYKTLQFRYFWNVRLDRKLLFSVWEGFSYPTLGVAVKQGVRVVERMLASLVTVGGVSAYYFAFRIVSAAQSLIGVSFATTATPTMTQFALAQNRVALTKFLRRRLLLIALSSIPVSLLMAMFSGPIMELLYGHGNFDAQSIQMSSSVLFWLAIGFVFMCMMPVMMSAVYSLQDMKEALVISVILTLINIGSAFLLSTWFGLPGLSLAVGGTAICAWFGVILYLRKSNIKVLV